MIKRRNLEFSIVGYIWNVADAANPASYVLHRSTKAHKNYMNSCFGGQCVKKIKISQSVFGQWIKECTGMLHDALACTFMYMGGDKKLL